MKDIIEKITRDTTVRPPSIHSITHWDRVAEFGRIIADNEPVNARVIVLFAYFHDCMRQSDGYDPQHGPRAADYIQTFPSSLLNLEDAESRQLQFACRHHTYEVPTDDLTIMACWDADRLDLGRAGITPDPTRLFTGTAIELATQGV